MMSHDSTGGFAHLHGLTSDQRERSCKWALEEIAARGIETVRLSFADQHGILRGKALVADEIPAAMINGCTMTSTLLVKDTSHRTIYPVWQAGAGLDMDAMTGAGDFIMLPDPSTFRVLPWTNDTGWMLCDIYFADGSPVPFSTRHRMRDALDTLDERGWGYRAGLEVEFHIFKLDNANLAAHHAGQPGTPPDVSLLAHGFQYLTENRAEQLEPVTDILRRACHQLRLPLRSIETEFGPSQVEFTFKPCDGLAAADNMMVFRSAVKQICARQGLHASFMCRPRIANLFSSGWHLHQCLFETRSGANLFTPSSSGETLSQTARAFVAGLLDHAPEAAVFSTPTINGYKRYQPHTLAPDRITWGIDNKGAMIRALGRPGDQASRIENRAGEPAANPYLYMMSQIVSGLDGIDRKAELGPPVSEPYSVEAPRLPASLMDAVDAIDRSDFFRARLGDGFIDYLVTIKRAEIARFLSEVTDWEHREYFDIY